VVWHSGTDGTGSFVCTWAQHDERPADLHMAQPNVPASKTGHFPPARLVRGVRAMQGDQALATIGKLVLAVHTLLYVLGLKTSVLPNSLWHSQMCQ
jgi:hypothetical protein